MSERVRVYISFLLICSIWGSTWLVIKIGLESVPPFLGAGLRFVVASTVLYFLIRMRHVEITWGKESQLLYISTSFASFSIPFALVYWGEQYIPSGLTSILFAIYPFAVALFSYLFLPSEKVSLTSVAGIVMGFAGIVVIFSHDLHASHPLAMWGMLAIILSAILQAFSIIIIKRLGHSTHPMVISFVPMFYGAFMLLTASLLVEDYGTVSLSSSAVLSILYLGIFGSVVTFVSYFWLLKRTEAVLLSLTAFITPIVAIILGIVILQEEFSQRIFLGAGFVLTGIIVANSADLRRILRSRR